MPASLTVPLVLPVAVAEAARPRPVLARPAPVRPAPVRPAGPPAPAPAGRSAEPPAAPSVGPSAGPGASGPAAARPPRPEAPGASRDLLAGSARELLAAGAAEDPESRYAHAHLSALRAAAAVLAARARPRARRSGRVRSAWSLLTEVAPELGEWAAFFAAGAGKRAAAEAGLRGVVSGREADDLMRDAEAFLAVVARVLGVTTRQPPLPHDAGDDPAPRVGPGARPGARRPDTGGAAPGGGADGPPRLRSVPAP